MTLTERTPTPPGYELYWQHIQYRDCFLGTNSRVRFLLRPALQSPGPQSGFAFL